MNNYQRGSLLSMIFGIIFITIGMSYSFYSYGENGTTDNTISSGNIRFHYGEGNRGINISDAMPIPDDEGIIQEKYFDFTITSKTSSSKIPYYITVRRKGNDTSLDNAVKLFLTEVTNKNTSNENENPVVLANNKSISKFSELTTYTNASLNIDSTKNEKILYKGEVPKNNTNYKKDYRLRMWVADDTTYNQTETGTCSDSTYNNEVDCKGAGKDWTKTASAVSKSFTLTVNVYTED